MKTLFSMGIQSPKHSFWMGQQTAYITATPVATQTKETSWEDVLAQGIKSGADIYGSYGDVQESKYGAEGKSAEAEAKEAAARTAQIMQQTLTMQQQSSAKQGQIAGIDKTAFYIGASLLGLLTVGGIFMMLGKK